MAIKLGTVAWWLVVIISIPFSAYAALFLYGDFDIYKKATVLWNAGRFDEAGLHIQQNLRAWQVHVLGAYAFMVAAPFQFSPTFRKNNPVIHRRLGYLFVAGAVVTALSALLVLSPHTEFGNIAKLTFNVAAVAQLSFVFLAVKAARAKDFDSHRKFMIRTAAIGYAVMFTRLLPNLLIAAGVEFYASFDYSMLVCFSVNSLLADLYIRTALRPSSSSSSVKLKPA